MFRFLRKIRYTLLNEGHLSKYAAYAMGEILLVVIGILIALQINNWNEERQERAKLKEYFSTIIQNTERDITNLKGAIETRQKVHAANQKAMHMYASGTYDIDIFIEASRFFLEFYFSRADMGYQSLINSGLTGRISNTKIGELLNEYHKILDQLHRAETSYNEFIENVEANFRQNYPSAIYSLIIRSIVEQEWIDKSVQEEMKLRKNELLPYFKSYEFQAAVSRTSSRGVGAYEYSIELGESLITELQNYIDSH